MFFLVSRLNHKMFFKGSLIPMNSDAAFHEESEYVVGFKIRVKKGGLSSFFRKKSICF